MQIKVAAACALVVIGLSAWSMLSAGRHRDDPARSPAVPSAGPLDVRSAVLADEIARLRRSHQTAEAPQRARDPFRFVAAAPRLAPVPAAAPAPSVPQAPPRPILKLIGVAEDTAAGGRPVRTAIISGPGQLYVVREGEKVASRYGVARISADVVELVDASDSSALRLSLK